MTGSWLHALRFLQAEPFSYFSRSVVGATACAVGQHAPAVEQRGQAAARPFTAETISEAASRGAWQRLEADGHVPSTSWYCPTTSGLANKLTREARPAPQHSVHAAHTYNAQRAAAYDLLHTACTAQRTWSTRCADLP